MECSEMICNQIQERASRQFVGFFLAVKFVVTTRHTVFPSRWHMTKGLNIDLIIRTD